MKELELTRPAKSLLRISTAQNPVLPVLAIFLLAACENPDHHNGLLGQEEILPDSPEQSQDPSLHPARSIKCGPNANHL